MGCRENIVGSRLKIESSFGYSQIVMENKYYAYLTQ